MTSANKKANAEVVLVFPAGAIRQQDGDFRLIAVSKDTVKWFRLTPMPEKMETDTKLRKSEVHIRQVDNQFLYADGSWLRVVPPLKPTKTYFQVQRVEHTVVIKRSDAVLVKYKRSGDSEWVSTAQPKASGRYTKAEDAKQKEFALANG